MSRRRMGVVLLLPDDVTVAVDGLRRACGDRTLGRVPAHVTLVPPVNVREADVPTSERLLRDAAATTAPFVLVVGPGATFHPVTPVAYLAVGGDTEALVRLRSAVFHQPLHRPDRFPYVPHVTLVDGAPDGQLVAITAALTEPLATFTADAVHLMEETRDDDGVRRWRPVLGVPFGASAAVQRGAFPMRLQVEGNVTQWAVVARVGDEEIGRAAVARAGEGCVRILSVDVRSHARGQGAGRALVAAAIDHAAAGYGRTMVADDHPFLRHLGFGPVADRATLQREIG